MQQLEEFAQIVHTFYRLSNTATSLKYLLIGILKVFNHYLSFQGSKIILKNVDSHPITYARLASQRHIQFRKGGMRLLSYHEKKWLSNMKELYSRRKVIVPIIFGDTTGLFIGARSPKHTTPVTDEEKRKVKMLVESASLLIRNYQLFEEQRKILVGSIKALSKFLSHSIPTSSIHSEMMSRLVKDLSRELHLSKIESGALEYAAMLHDAGKVNVPIDILSKETPLTEHEYSLIKSHPKEGVAMVRDLHLLKPVLPIILYHHERYDGTGYPSGLKKKQIPLGARILAIIDAFDAMIFGRPYKKKISMENAIGEFKGQRGTQFDPEIVDAFLKVLSREHIRKYLNRIV